MRTDMRGKDFVTLMDYTGEELQTILDVAFDLKRQNAMGAEHELLKNKTLGMIFAQPSTRTRVSFETGMTQLGGHAQYYSEDNMQRKNKETWEDTGLVLSRYCLLYTSPGAEREPAHYRGEKRRRRHCGLYQLRAGQPQAH